MEATYVSSTGDIALDDLDIYPGTCASPTLVPVTTPPAQSKSIRNHLWVGI